MSTAHISEAAAIQAALAHDWNEAVRQNLVLLKNDKNNVNLLNRLGFAYLQNGQLSQAKKIFLKATKIDTYNQIAAKNLKKLGHIRQKDFVNPRPNGAVTPISFLEEPGKTKIVECVNTAPFAILSTVCPGEEAVLNAKNHVVEVRSSKNVYLGAIPDDLSFRLIKFMAVGNTYQALIQSVAKNVLIIFIRERSRGKKFLNQPSFSSTTLSIPFFHTEKQEETDDTERDTKSQDADPS